MFEVNNTYRPSAFGGHHTVSTTSNSMHSSVFGRQSSSHTGYSGIGQYRIIGSQFEQPHMAEVSELYGLPIGAENVFGEETNHAIRKVSGNDHMPDPMQDPIGDIPWLLMLAMIMGYAGLRMLKRKMSRHA